MGLKPPLVCLDRVMGAGVPNSLWYPRGGICLHPVWDVLQMQKKTPSPAALKRFPSQKNKATASCGIGDHAAAETPTTPCLSAPGADPLTAFPRSLLVWPSRNQTHFHETFLGVLRKPGAACC